MSTFKVDPNFLNCFQIIWESPFKTIFLFVLMSIKPTHLINIHIIMGKNVGFANFTNRSVSQSFRIQTVWLCSIHMDNFVMKPFFLMPYEDKIIVHNIGIKTNIWDKVWTHVQVPLLLNTTVLTFKDHIIVEMLTV